MTNILRVPLFIAASSILVALFSKCQNRKFEENDSLVRIRGKSSDGIMVVTDMAPFVPIRTEEKAADCIGVFLKRQVLLTTDRCTKGVGHGSRLFFYHRHDRPPLNDEGPVNEGTVNSVFTFTGKLSYEEPTQGSRTIINRPVIITLVSDYRSRNLYYNEAKKVIFSDKTPVGKLSVRQFGLKNCTDVQACASAGLHYGEVSIVSKDIPHHWRWKFFVEESVGRPEAKLEIYDSGAFVLTETNDTIVLYGFLNMLYEESPTGTEMIGMRKPIPGTFIPYVEPFTKEFQDWVNVVARVRERDMQRLPE